MGFQLSNNEKKILFEDELINSNFISKAVDVSFTEQSFLVQFSYKNGSAPVNFNLILEASGDGVNWAQFTDHIQQITDASGAITFDVALSAAEFVRISIEHTEGTVEASCIMVGKRRH